MDNLFSFSPNGWVPLKIIINGGSLHCQWFYVGDKPFTEPFFSDTLAQCRFFPENLSPIKPQTALKHLPQIAESTDSVAPTAFIFHVSRCGSTLLSQLLSLQSGHLVLSEVPFLDEVLRLPYNKKAGQKESETSALFDAALRLYAQRRLGEEEKLFIKLDSWHLLFYNQLRQLYAGVPFIILLRSPAEVIQSHRKLRGMQSVPGMLEPELFGFSESDITYNLDVYMTKVLERYLGAIQNILPADSKTLLIDYKEGPQAMMEKVFSFTGINPTDGYLNLIQERMQYHGKRPEEVFRKEKTEKEVPAYLHSCNLLYEQISRRIK